MIDWIWDAVFIPRSLRTLVFLLFNQLLTFVLVSSYPQIVSDSVIAVALGHNQIQLWDWNTSKLLFQVKGELLLSFSISLFVSDNCLIAATGTVLNSQILLWHPLSSPKVTLTPPEYFSYGFQVVASLTGHTGAILQSCWSPDGSALASVSDDRSACIWTGLNSITGKSP